jgi:hypothetical protein
MRKCFLMSTKEAQNYYQPNKWHIHASSIDLLIA